MSFFGPIWKILGFEDEERPEKKKKVQTMTASFDLSNNNHHKQLPSTRQARNQKEVQEILEELKQIGTLVIDVSNFQENRQRSLDFISGAIFALEGQFSKINEDKFYCSISEE